MNTFIIYLYKDKGSLFSEPYGRNPKNTTAIFFMLTLVSNHNMYGNNIEYAKLLIRHSNYMYRKFEFIKERSKNFVHNF